LNNDQKIDFDELRMTLRVWLIFNLNTFISIYVNR
jgi:hypothetical protein